MPEKHKRNACAKSECKDKDTREKLVRKKIAKRNKKHKEKFVPEKHKGNACAKRRLQRNEEYTRERLVRKEDSRKKLFSLAQIKRFKELRIMTQEERKEDG